MSPPICQEIDQLIANARAQGLRPAGLFISRAANREFQREVASPNDRGTPERRILEGYNGLPVTVTDDVERLYLVSFGDEKS